MKENKEVKVYFDASGEKALTQGISKVKEVKGNNENKKGVDKMKENKKELKELVREVEAKRLLLAEKVLKWSQSLNPIRDVHVKIKGRYYPLIEKETSRLYVIDKVRGKKIPFNTLEQNMKYVILSVLAERKEQIEKEVQEEKKKYLQKKLEEVEDLLNKF